MMDAELVPLAANGDVEAFETLYRAYFPFAVNVARQRGAADPEAVAQDVFMLLVQGRWRLNPGKRPTNGRLFGFVRALTVLATWKSFRPGEMVGLVRSHPDEQPSPEVEVLNRELSRCLRGALKALPPHLQAVAYYRYEDELSGPDIADRIGVGASTIPGYFYQVRRVLRAALVNVYALPEPHGRARGGHRRINLRRA